MFDSLRLRPATAAATSSELPRGYVDRVYSLGSELLLIELWTDPAMRSAPRIRGELSRDSFEVTGLARELPRAVAGQGETARWHWVVLPIGAEMRWVAYLENLQVQFGDTWHRLNGGFRCWIRPDVAARLREIQICSREEIGVIVELVEDAARDFRSGTSVELLRRAGVAQMSDVLWHRGPSSREVGPTAAVERALISRDSTLLVWGWLWDPRGLTDGFEVRLAGKTRRLDAELGVLRYERSDVIDSYLARQNPRRPLQDRPGFFFVLELGGAETAPGEIQLALVGGHLRVPIELSPPEILSPSEAVLVASSWMREEDQWHSAARLGILESLERLARGAFGYRTVWRSSAGAPAAVRVVISASPRRDVMRCQLAEIAAGRGPRPELIYVTDDADLAAAWSAECEDLFEVYGLSSRVVLSSPGATWAERVNGAVELVATEQDHDLDSEPTLVFLDGDVLPSDRSWLSVFSRLCDRIAVVGAEVCGVDDLSLPRCEAVWAVESVSSSCLAIRSDRFRELQGFRIRLPGHRDDGPDLCHRARARGWISARAPVVVCHLGGRACPREDPNRSRSEIEVERDDSAIVSEDPRSSAAARTSPKGSDGRVSLSGRGAPSLGTGSVADVSIVLPTLNAGPDLEEVLDRLEGQRTAARAEILCIDSCSSDGTPERVLRRGHRVLPIGRATFDHGLTRNLGVAETSAPLVAFLSQDALPADDRWLEGLIEAFDSPSVAGAYSRQSPRENASPIARELLAHWVAASAVPRVQKLDDLEAFAQLPRSERHLCLTFDNVSSMARREILTALPFRQVDFAEDRDWGFRVLMEGFHLRYVPSSVVLHSHETTVWEEARRIFLDHEALEAIFPGGITSSWIHVLREGWSGSQELAGVARRAQDGSRLRRMAGAMRAFPRGLVRRLAQESGARVAVGSKDGRRSARIVRRLFVSSTSSGD